MLFAPESTQFTACAALIGGHVGGPSWLAMALSQKVLLKTILRVGRGLRQPLHVHFHKSLDGCADASCRAVVIAFTAAEKNPGTCAWDKAQKWKHMQLIWISCDASFRLAKPASFGGPSFL